MTEIKSAKCQWHCCFFDSVGAILYYGPNKEELQFDHCEQHRSPFLQMLGFNVYMEFRPSRVSEDYKRGFQDGAQHMKNECLVCLTDVRDSERRTKEIYEAYSDCIEIVYSLKTKL